MFIILGRIKKDKEGGNKKRKNRKIVKVIVIGEGNKIRIINFDRKLVSCVS